MLLKQSLLPFCLFLLLSTGTIKAQEMPSEQKKEEKSMKSAAKDSLKSTVFNFYAEDLPPVKIKHAEPLYIDLIRDLGARKGEKEWNIGGGLNDKRNYDSYEMLVEYEWAPIDRLGLEIEIPFTLNNNYRGTTPALGSAPANRVESLKTAFQYTFSVSAQKRRSLAIGSIQELEFSDVNQWGKSSLFTGFLFNPFFIAAQRLGQNWHSLIYTGPRFLRHFNSVSAMDVSYEINSSFHYMIPKSRNFIGLEINQLFDNDRLTTVLRPQMRVELNPQLMIGIVPAIPLSRTNQGLGSFIRIIYEPH